MNEVLDTPLWQRWQELWRQNPDTSFALAALAKALDVENSREFRRFVFSREALGEVLIDDRKMVHPWASTGCIMGRLLLQNDGRGRVSGRDADARALVLVIAPDAFNGAKPGDLVAATPDADAESGKTRRKSWREHRDHAHAGRVVKVLQRDRLDAPLMAVVERQGRQVQLVGLSDSNARYFSVAPAVAKALRHGEVVLIRKAETLPHDAGVRAVELRRFATLDDPADDQKVIEACFQLPGEFSAPALAELPSREPKWSAKGRRDLREATIITIDPVDAKDFDDALSLEVLPDGARVGVHIADVAHFVKPGGALDVEARERGTSVYLPGTVIPMLPPQLSNEWCSLKPNVPRYALSVFLDFDAEGARRGFHIEKTLITSTRRFHYGEVLAFLFGRADAPALSPELAELLTKLDALAGRLRERRVREGSLMLDIPRARITLDDAHLVKAVTPDQSDRSHQLVEEFMLAANRAVAEHLVARGLPYLGRSHDAPSASDLDDLSAFLSELGFRGASASPAPGRQQQRRERGGQSRRRGPGSQPSGALAPSDLPRVLAWASKRADAACVHLALLKSLRRARYQAEPGLHFALGWDFYTHFTSPIRRAPDLVVHQMLTEELSSETPSHRRLDWDFALPALADNASFTERRADDAERALVKLKLLRRARESLGDVLGGRITHFGRLGFSVELEGLWLEGLVKYRDIERGHAQISRFQATITTSRGQRRFRVGDRVETQITRVDLIRRELDLTLA